MPSNNNSVLSNRILTLIYRISSYKTLSQIIPVFCSNSTVNFGLMYYDIFGLKMMVKSGLEKICFEIPPWGKMVIFITEFVILGTFMK